MSDLAIDFGSVGSDDSNYSSGDGGSLAESILQSGTSLASTAILAGANPTNVALLQGQTVSTPALTTGSPTTASLGISSSGLLIILALGAIVFFMVRR